MTRSDTAWLYAGHKGLAAFAAGAQHLQGAELATWLVEHEYTSIKQLQGNLSQRFVTFPSAFERAHYVRAVSSDVQAPSPKNYP